MILNALIVFVLYAIVLSIMIKKSVSKKIIVMVTIVAIFFASLPLVLMFLSGDKAPDTKAYSQEELWESTGLSEEDKKHIDSLLEDN